MFFGDCVIIFISGYLAKSKLSIFSNSLLFVLLPLVSLVIMIREIPLHHDFYSYLAIILFTGVSILSVWVFPAFYSESPSVEVSMYIVTAIVGLISMVLFAAAEVLPNDMIESILKPLIVKGNTYDIWSRPPYQLAHFFIMAGCFPYFSVFIISKTILKIRSYKKTISLAAEKTANGAKVSH